MPRTQSLEVGDPAPEFTLRDADGKKTKLSGFRGKYVILYFYPEDDSPACTTQACEFTHMLESLARPDIAVVGISPDSPQNHSAFIAKHTITFTLLSDMPDADGTPTTIAKYGAWGKKTLYGKDYVGLIRSTYIIDKDGKVLEKCMNIRATGHVGRIVTLLKTLGILGNEKSADNPTRTRMKVTPAKQSRT